MRRLGSERMHHTWALAQATPQWPAEHTGPILEKIIHAIRCAPAWLQAQPLSLPCVRLHACPLNQTGLMRKTLSGPPPELRQQPPPRLALGPLPGMLVQLRSAQTAPLDQGPFDYDP